MNFLVKRGTLYLNKIASLLEDHFRGRRDHRQKMRRPSKDLSCFESHLSPFCWLHWIASEDHLEKLNTGCGWILLNPSIPFLSSLPGPGCWYDYTEESQRAAHRGQLHRSRRLTGSCKDWGPAFESLLMPEGVQWEGIKTCRWGKPDLSIF